MLRVLVTLHTLHLISILLSTGKFNFRITSFIHWCIKCVSTCNINIISIMIMIIFLLATVHHFLLREYFNVNVVGHMHPVVRIKEFGSFG